MKWPEFRSIWCKGPAIKSSEKTFSTFVHFYCLDKLSRKMAYQCITCKKFVNKRREALLCNGCNSGVSWETYRDAVGSGEDIPWKCESCSASRASLPNFESMQPSTALNQKPRWNLCRNLSVTSRKTGIAAQLGRPSAGAYLCNQ